MHKNAPFAAKRIDLLGLHNGKTYLWLHKVDNVTIVDEIFDTIVNGMFKLHRARYSLSSFRSCRLLIAVRLAIQLLHILEVHTCPHSNVLFTSCLQTILSIGHISALLHFYDSKQRLRDRATLLMSPHLYFTTRRRP